MAILMAVVIGVGIATLAIGLAFAQNVWWAWWVYPAWGWFLEPLGVPHVSLVVFMGLVMFLRAAQAGGWPTKATDSRRTAGEWIVVAIGLVFGPITAWVLLRTLHGLL